MTAADPRLEPVGAVDHAARLEPLEHEARRLAQRGVDVVGDEQRRARAVPGVLQPQADHGRAADRDAVGLHRAPDGDPVVAPAQHQDGDERQRDEQHRDPQQVALPEGQRDHRDHEPGPEHRATAQRQPAQVLAHPHASVGTGTRVSR